MSELVDLSKLQAPKVLEDLDYEKLLQARKEKFISLFPQEKQNYWREILKLESEPVTKLLEENCYLQLLERQRINSAAQATMLAYATGSDLDVIAENYNVKRLVITEANYDVTPQIEEELESDTDLRLRCQLAFEGLSVAGPRSAYIFHALSAHGDVADVSVVSPQPAYVTISILSRKGNGTASEEVLNAVRKKLNDDDVRPIADRVTVQTCVSNCNRSETDQSGNHDPFYDDLLKDYADLSQRDRFKPRNFEQLDDFDDWNFDVFH